MTEEVITDGSIAASESAAPAASEAPVTPSSSETPDFRSLLPEEYRGMYPEFKKPEDFVKGYDELVRKMGSSLSIPKEDASPEELNKFYSRLGRPESPDKYEFEIQDGSTINKEFLDGFRQNAFENGFSQKQAKQLYDWYNKEAQAVEAYYEQAQQEAQAKAEAELKVKWGRNYEEKLEEVRGFAKRVAGDESFSKLEKYGNDPEFISLLATIKDRFVKEDRLIPQAAVDVPSGDYREEARKIMSEPDYARNEVKQAKVRELFQKYASQLNSGK